MLCHRAEGDLGVWAEDAVEAVLPPEHGGWGVAVGDAAQRGRVLPVLQVVEAAGLDPDGGRVVDYG